MSMIVFEGGEGTGKSTQAFRCVEQLECMGLQVMFAREPGGTPAGENVRQMLLSGSSMPAVSEFFLFQAARAALIEQRIRPALESGHVVVLDRYVLSTMAYQIAARGLPREQALQAIALATGGLDPDLYLVFSVPPEVGLERTRGRHRSLDRIDREHDEFHALVYHEYERLGRELPNAVLIDASRSPDVIFQEVMQHIHTRVLRGVLHS